MALQKLSEVLSYDYKGPKTNLGALHVLKALLVIGKENSIGRGKLSKLLSIGQGEVRTLISRLREKGLISIKKEGCVLTHKGLREYKSALKLLPWSGLVDGTSIALGRICYAVIVRGRSDKVRKGLEQRDAAVKSGANGALTIIYKKGKFRIPSEARNWVLERSSEPWITIRSARLQEGDTVIISGADSSVEAEHGALAAALTLI